MVSKNTAKIIRFLLRNLEKPLNINELAKALGISVGSSFKVLKDLEKEKIVMASTLGNAVFYRLNLDNPEAFKLCELLLMEERRLLSGYAKLYSESLQEFGQAGLIVLFGSILKGKFNDVDVLFMAEKAGDVSNFCLELSKVRAKPVVPLILGREDLVSELKRGNEAIMALAKEGIVLKGESVFIGVLRDAKKNIRNGMVSL